MAELLIELNKILISRKVALTTEESKLMNSWKQAALRDSGIGALGASLATWLVTRRLQHLFYFNLPVGAGLLYGKWRYDKYMDSVVELILSQHGTRLQKELGEIMLKKYQHNPPVSQSVSKYFYSENVYDDDSTDLPKLRWRFRSTYGEIFPSREIEGDDSSSKRSHLENTDLRKTNLERKLINMNDVGVGVGFGAAAALESTEDPFDCVLGHQMSADEIHHPDAPSTLPRRRNHSHRQSHSRRRMHRYENMVG